MLAYDAISLLSLALSLALSLFFLYVQALPADLHEWTSPAQLHAALEQFDVVGVTERIPELIAAVSMQLQCPGNEWVRLPCLLLVWTGYCMHCVSD
jgi:hypothetical protein